MFKKLSTLLIAACMAVPSMAQTYSSNDGGVLYAPQKGQWQVSVFFGGASTFYNENTSYLLPNFNQSNGQVGLPNGGVPGVAPEGSYVPGANSGDLSTYLNISGLNNNNLTNIVGFEGKYFISNCWDINLQFSMNVNLTPKKDFVEGDATVDDMVIPAHKFVNAQMTNNWYVNVGSNHYFKTKNARIHPYLGASVGFQMARIETTEPYTGDTHMDSDMEDELEGLPTQMYLAGSRAGQMFGIKGAGVAGIEYSIAPGLLLGFQFQPVAYRYDVIQICPKGFDRYNVSHHNIKLFEMPMLKLGIRF